MLRSAFAFLVIIIATFVASAQSFTDDLALARSVKLLDATEKDIDALFSDPTSPFDKEHARFARDSTVIHISYSSGRCNDRTSYGVDVDDWNVGAGKVVMIELMPREDLAINQLGLGLAKLSDEKLFRGDYTDRIHYNKAEGIAVVTIGGRVERVMLFPFKSSYSRLCSSEKIARYYSRTSWRRDPRPKYACILRNQYANVIDVAIVATSDRLFSIKTNALDPENDVLTYNYQVTAGKIIGTGANVVWDLSDAATGTYSVHAGVDDGAGILGKTITKSIRIE